MRNLEKVRNFLRDRFDKLWASEESMASTDSTAFTGSRWLGAQGQTPFWAEPSIISSWVFAIDDKMLLNPFTCLWSRNSSDDSIFNGGGEAGSSSVVNFELPCSTAFGFNVKHCIAVQFFREREREGARERESEEGERERVRGGERKGKREREDTGENDKSCIAMVHYIFCSTLTLSVLPLAGGHAELAHDDPERHHGAKSHSRGVQVGRVFQGERH